jgi:hypothetical protein
MGVGSASSSSCHGSALRAIHVTNHSLRTIHWNFENGSPFHVLIESMARKFR